MVLVVAVLVIVLLLVGVAALNMRRSSIEKRSVVGYKKTLGVLSDVVKRSESFGYVHQPTDEEIGQPHILRIDDSEQAEFPDTTSSVNAKKMPRIVEAPRVKILPNKIASDTKIIFDDFNPSPIPPPTTAIRVKVDMPAPDQDLSELVTKLRPEKSSEIKKEATVKDKQQTDEQVSKRNAVQKTSVGKSTHTTKAPTVLPGRTEDTLVDVGTEKESSLLEEPLTEVISLAELESSIKSPKVTKRRLDTSGSRDKPVSQSNRDATDQGDDFGFITANSRLRKISTVAASIVALAALAAGIEQLSSQNSRQTHNALVAKQHTNKAKGNIVKPTQKKKTGGTTPNNSGSSGIVPISASPSVVSYAAPKGTYTITIKASSQGRCWVGVQAKTNGPYLWMSTINPGSSATYHASGTIIVRVGAPPYATIEVNGVDVTFPKSNIQPFDMVFTPVNSGAERSS